MGHWEGRSAFWDRFRKRVLYALENTGVETIELILINYL